MTQGFQCAACKLEFPHTFLHLKVTQKSFGEHVLWWCDTEYEVNVETKCSKCQSKMGFTNGIDKSRVTVDKEKSRPWQPLLVWPPQLSLVFSCWTLTIWKNTNFGKTTRWLRWIETNTKALCNRVGHRQMSEHKNDCHHSVANVTNSCFFANHNLSFTLFFLSSR